MSRPSHKTPSVRDDFDTFKLTTTMSLTKMLSDKRRSPKKEDHSKFQSQEDSDKEGTRGKSTLKEDSCMRTSSSSVPKIDNVESALVTLSLTTRGTSMIWCDRGSRGGSPYEIARMKTNFAAGL